jgi:hypothetical protein
MTMPDEDGKMPSMSKEDDKDKKEGAKFGRAYKTI